MARAYITVNLDETSDRGQTASFELDSITDSRHEDEIVDDLIFQLHCYKARRASRAHDLSKLRAEARDAYNRLSYGDAVEIPELNLFFPAWTFSPTLLEYAGAEILPKLTTAFNRIADERERAEALKVGVDDLESIETIKP